MVKAQNNSTSTSSFDVDTRDDDKLEIRLSCGWITGFISAQNVLVITSLRTGFRNTRIPSVPFSFVM